VAEAKVALNATPTASSPLVDTGTPGFGDEVVTIPAGTFVMGTPTTEKDRGSDETQHRVIVSSFMMARTEVSQALWTMVMGKNPSKTEYDGVSLVGERLPVQKVSWCDVVDFANRLSRPQGLTVVYAGVSECEATYGVSVTVRSGATGWRLPT
jgi:formylglycine-generating enzyme required for sulfatase activity